MITVSNEKSKHFGLVGKVIGEEDGKKLVFFRGLADNIFVFDSSELKEHKRLARKKNHSKKSNKVPVFRSEFYQYIQNERNNANDIINLIKKFEREKKIVFKQKSHNQDSKGINKNSLFNYIKKNIKERSKIVEQIRVFRDKNFLKMTLPGSQFNPTVKD